MSLWQACQDCPEARKWRASFTRRVIRFITAREITRRSAAAELECEPAHLSRVLNAPDTMSFEFVFRVGYHWPQFQGAVLQYLQVLLGMQDHRDVVGLAPEERRVLAVTILAGMRERSQRVFDLLLDLADYTQLTAEEVEQRLAEMRDYTKGRQD